MVATAGDGWRVAILDPLGEETFVRSFGSEEEARLFASTVDQHISWLSEDKFRRYYRLDRPEEG